MNGSASPKNPDPRAARATGGSDLTLEHIVALLEITDGSGLIHGAERRAAEAVDQLLATAGATRQLYTRLENLAKDAGYATDRLGLLNGHATHRELEALLARDDWQDPAEVLDPTGEIGGVDHTSLIAACRARMARGEGDPPLLRRVLDRLEHTSAP